MIEPPVEAVSSKSTTRIPSTAMPSTRRRLPWDFSPLRIENHALSATRSATAWATGSAPIVMPADRVVLDRAGGEVVDDGAGGELEVHASCDRTPHVDVVVTCRTRGKEEGLVGRVYARVRTSARSSPPVGGRRTVPVHVAALGCRAPCHRIPT